MTILLHPPDSRQNAGFYLFLFDALRKYMGARMATRQRPVPRMEHPRQHESVWIDWDGVPVVVDMSDHVQLFDVPALKQCKIYFKANLNGAMAKKVLKRAGAEAHCAKIQPFMFLPPTLAGCARIELITRLARRSAWRPYDFCHVVGVYNNPFLRGAPTEAERDIAPDPQTNHFWVRYQTQRALRETGLKGFCRLTNRGDPALLDPKGVVRSNLSPGVYLAAMLASRMTVLNTLPHAVFPWKAWESVALGIPFIAERRPLIVMPKEWELVAGRHYLEWLPELPEFDEMAEPDDLRAYRLFPEIRLERLKERAEWICGEIRNRTRMAEMRAEVEDYRRRVLSPRSIAETVAGVVASSGKIGGSEWDG